jgi:hypothetical protein
LTSLKHFFSNEIDILSQKFYIQHDQTFPF